MDGQSRGECSAVSNRGVLLANGKISGCETYDEASDAPSEVESAREDAAVGQGWCLCVSAVRLSMTVLLVGKKLRGWCEQAKMELELCAVI